MALPAVAMTEIPTPRLLEEFPPTELPTEIQAKLRAPLPPEAITQHPTRKFLSSIKPAFVIERMNEAFGIGAYKESYREISINTVTKKWKEDEGKTRDVTLFVATVHGTLTVRKYGIHLENFGGSENEDAGDALKGACTDAFTKMCSHLGVGLDVYKGKAHSGDEKEPARKCPECGKEGTIIKGKEEFGGGLLCWTKKGGCGAKFADGELDGQKKPPKAEPAAPPDKITIHGKVADLRQENQTLWFKTGVRICASKNPDIMKKMFGGNGKLAVLLVSEISVKGSPVFQVHKVVSLRAEREAAGYEAL